MDKPFVEKSLKKPGIFYSIFKKLPKSNALIEINNLLASSYLDFSKIPLYKIDEVEVKYKTNLLKKFHDQLIQLFSQYIDYCLIDKKIDDLEIKNFKVLKSLLRISENDIQKVIKEKTESLYYKETSRVVEDGVLDSNEKNYLDSLKKNLMLSDEIAENLYSTAAISKLQNWIDGAIVDERLSEEEEIEFARLKSNLDVDVEMKELTTMDLDRFRLYWQIENAELPQLAADIALQKNEILHFTSYINWNEIRKVTTRVNYAGPSVRIKIAKGLYYRAGSMRIQPISQDVWQQIDSGKLYLTNNRLIFMGNLSNKIIKLSSILNFSPFKNGVDIQKSSGKSPFLEFENNVDIFSLILSRLLYSQ